MEEPHLIPILNNGRQSTKLQQPLRSLIDLMKEFNKNQIYFGNILLESENESDETYENIEPFINAAFILHDHGFFDYIIVESRDKENKKLIFSKKCGKAAYAFYKFFVMGYRLKDDIDEKYLNNELKGKTLEEIEIPYSRRIFSSKISCHEYTCYDHVHSNEDINFLREYLDNY